MGGGYQGWTNYETWNLVLWVDNEEPIYRARIDMLAALGRPVTAEDVGTFIGTYFPIGTPDFGASRLKLVNWAEIADHWELERKEMA